jgi:uncharacterized repeat protein (TIGR03803 family)
MSIKNLFLALTWTGLLAMPVTAQTLTTLHSFNFLTDGDEPGPGLVLSGTNLYGTTLFNGAPTYDGFVFSGGTNGSGFGVLHTFSLVQFGDVRPTNYDGAQPVYLMSSGNILYGLSEAGGGYGLGTVFSINGSNFTTLHSFSSTNDGSNPADLIASGNTLYGTAGYGGLNGSGTIFSLNTNGLGYTNVYNFTATDINGDNSDGAQPAGLLLSGSTLYGTTSAGGANGFGTVFSLNIIGSPVIITLHTFTGGSDGGVPLAGLILSSNTLYGTTSAGGTNGSGTVFSLNLNNLMLTNLHSFTATNNAGANSDGAAPEAGLVLSSNTLYGTASTGGSSGNGTLFKVNTDGTDFRNLHNFAVSDGAKPVCGLILSGGTLYGTTQKGGQGGIGTVFALALAPTSLSIAAAGTNVVLTWPTNATGFTLEFATNLASPVWNTNLPAPAVVNTNNAVTNGISGTRKFYRLSQ